MNSIKIKSGIIAYLFLIGMSLLPLTGLLKPGLPITHDGQDHVARIANFYTSLIQGNIIPRWAGNLNWGYGHPILEFLYPFPSYFASFFKFIGFSSVDSTKLVFGIGYIVSLLSMYLWVNHRWGKLSGIIASVSYGFSPYRFIDLYVRGAIGEHIAFIFPPLILYFLDKISENIKSNKPEPLPLVCLSLSVFGLILSHNAIALMFLPIIFIYVLYLSYFECRFNLKFFIFRVFVGLSLGFLLSAFFWIPAYFEGKYTLRDIVTGNETIKRFVPLSKFFIPTWNYGGSEEFSKDIGIMNWLGIITSLFFIVKSKIMKDKVIMGGLLIIFIITIFLMTSWSSIIWTHLRIMLKFQFPWRFLTVSVFCVSVVTGISAGYIIGNNWKSNLIKTIIVVSIFAGVVSTYWMWHVKSYLIKPEMYYSGIYSGTTDTGESSPIWSVRFMEHNPLAPAEVIEGDADIISITRSFNQRYYSVNAKVPTNIVENTLYFPGWKIFVDNQQAKIQYQDPAYRGLMEYWVPNGKHKVKIIYTRTKIRFIADIISIIGFIIVIGLTLYQILWKKRFS
jgi:hypothetical protein